MPKKVLIVDDEKEMLEALNTKLTADGYEVSVEPTARGGLMSAKKFKPDIIFLDILLPDMDGSEVAQLLQNDPEVKSIPVVFLSGIVTGAQGQQQSEVKAAGMTYRALGKPFTYGDLMNEMEYIWGPKELHNSDS